MLTYGVLVWAWCCWRDCSGVYCDFLQVGLLVSCFGVMLWIVMLVSCGFDLWLVCGVCYLLLFGVRTCGFCLCFMLMIVCCCVDCVVLFTCGLLVASYLFGWWFGLLVDFVAAWVFDFVFIVWWL